MTKDQGADFIYVKNEDGQYDIAAKPQAYLVYRIDGELVILTEQGKALGLPENVINDINESLDTYYIENREGVERGAVLVVTTDGIQSDQEQMIGILRSLFPGVLSREYDLSPATNNESTTQAMVTQKRRGSKIITATTIDP